MGHSYGKKFEIQFRNDWARTFPQSFIYRLADQQSYYHGTSSNPCDFICYNHGILFLIECKSIHGNTFAFQNLRQYPRLLEEKLRKTPGKRVGVVLWFVDHGKVIYCPIMGVAKMKKDRKKSINVKDIDKNMYGIIELPGRVRRVFIETDYSPLMKLDDLEGVPDGK